MGGLAVNCPDARDSVRYLSPGVVEFLHRHDPSIFSEFTPDIVQDRSKSDYLAKTLGALQALWFVTQCASRFAKSLPITSFEVGVYSSYVIVMDRH